MKELNHSQPMTLSDVQRGQTIGRVAILRDLEGPVCAHCGGLLFFLVFRVSRDGRNGVLEGRCSRCRNPRGLAADEIERACHA
jgi:hypothetical protein